MTCVLGFVLAGGEGSRLQPLTSQQSKPAVPFAGRYRIVDFVLSNLAHSDIHSIYLLVQYRSQSLIEHINKAWGLSHIIPGQFVNVVPPQKREGPEWFQGTADALVQNLYLIERAKPDLVAVFGADHIYRMDVRQMMAFHADNRADVTVAALPVPLEQAHAFGVIDADGSQRIRGFLEKPRQPPAMPGDPARAYGSMGNYLFETDVLLHALRDSKQRGESDFGHHILPRLVDTHRVFAYDFGSNRIPGIQQCEEPAYWRDVGDIDAYFAAHQDVMGPQPRFDLFNPQWLINSSNYQGPTPRLLGGHIDNVIIGAGSVLRGGSLRNTVIRREILIEEDAHLEDCIIMDYTVVRRGAQLRRVIVDRYNTIEAGTRIGYDAAVDRARYHVTDSGIVVIGKHESWPGTAHYRQ